MLRQLLMKQYPREWRDRYGDEFLAVLEDTALTPSVIIDTIRAAVDAHVCRMSSHLRRRRKPSPLVVMMVAATLMTSPLALRGPRRRLSLLPAFTG